MTTAARARISPVLSSMIALAIALLARPATAADTVVQVPVDSVLDGRTVSTVAGGTVTIWSPTQGVDGDGNGDGYVTNAVEAILKTQNKTEGGTLGVALPDDGVFAGTDKHPEIDLHFSNTAPTTSLQTRQMHQAKGDQMFQFTVPQATYSKMYILITASEGSAALSITLNYAGGTAATTTKYTLPDYGIGGAPANDATYFNLIANMHKWSPTDQEGDGPSHTITGIVMTPSPAAMLTSIQIMKTNGSHVVFWGATGTATSAVTTGAAGTGGNTDAGTDATGAAGTSVTGTGGAGTSATGAGGAASAGTSGSTGAAGTTTGAAGTTASTTGAAGTSTTGAAGTSGGGAGTSTSTSTTGAAGSYSSARSSGGGCSLSGASSRHGAGWVALLVVGGLVVFRRRRRL